MMIDNEITTKQEDLKSKLRTLASGLINNFGVDGALLMVRRLKKGVNREQELGDASKQAIFLFESGDNVKLERYLRKNFAYPDTLIDLSEKKGEYFLWLLRNNIHDRNIFDLELAYSNSSEGALMAIDQGFTDHETVVISYKYSKKPDLVRWLLENNRKSLTEVWSDDDLESIDSIINEDSVLGQVVLNAGPFNSDSKDIFNLLKGLNLSQELRDCFSSRNYNKAELQKIVQFYERDSAIAIELLLNGIDLRFWDQLLDYETSKRPKYNTFTVFTHAQQLTHLEKMFASSIKMGPSAFQLRSMAENNVLSVDTFANSPSGKASEIGETFLSTQLNTVAPYGEVVWVVLPDQALRGKPINVYTRDANFSMKSMADSRAEMSIYSEMGIVIALTTYLRNLRNENTDELIRTNFFEELDLAIRYNPNLVTIREKLLKYNSEHDQHKKIELLSSAIEIFEEFIDKKKKSPSGIELLAGNSICMAPKESQAQIFQMIDDCNLHASEKELLRKVFYFYEGQPYDAFHTLKGDREKFLEAFSKLDTANGNNGDQVIEDNLTAHESHLRRSLVSDKGSYYKLAEYSVESYSISDMGYDTAFSLLNVLRENESWNQLFHDLPRVSEFFLVEIIQRSWKELNKSGDMENTSTFDFQTKIQLFFNGLIEKLNKKASELDESEIDELAYILNINAKAIDGNSTLWEIWRGLVFKRSLG